MIQSKSDFPEKEGETLGEKVFPTFMTSLLQKHSIFRRRSVCKNTIINSILQGTGKKTEGER